MTAVKKSAFTGLTFAKVESDPSNSRHNDDAIEILGIAKTLGGAPNATLIPRAFLVTL